MRKSIKLYALTVLFWVLVAIPASLHLLALLGADASPGLRLSWGVAVLFLNYFWIFTSYHAITVIVAFFARATPQDKPRVCMAQKGLRSGKIAVLYATRNDLYAECAESCVNLDWPSLRVFICDDSEDEATKQEIDAFQQRHRLTCRVLRRSGRTGHKAGNLNHALRRIGPEYEYIVVVDHDSLLERGLINAALEYFEEDPALAFVQAKQRAVARPGSSFSADLSLGIDCLWDYLPLKNRFGLASCFGHGVVIRRSALEAVGGFPEIVSEDLALTTVLREAGYFGIVASDIVCGEGVPRNLNQYRRRYEKWCVGIIEFARLYLRSFLGNTRVSFVEKLDLVFHCLNLLGMVPLFLFIVWVNIVLPFGFGQYEQLTIESDTFGLAWHIPVISTRGSFSGVDSIFLRVVVLAGVLLPLSYFWKYFLYHPLQTIRHVAIAFTCFCATIVPSLLSMLIVLGGAAPHYRSTADPWEDPIYTPKSSTSGLTPNLRVGRIYSLIIETAIALFFLICALATLNLFLLSFALGAIAGPLFSFFSWDNKLLAALKYLPFSLLVVQLFIIGLPTIGYTGVFSHLVLIHF